MYAYYNANKYTVFYNSNGGNTPNPASKTVTYDSTYGTLASVSREGYTFNGWFTAASGGTKIETSTKVNITSNQTLYAHWTVNSYTVSIISSAGGSVNNNLLVINYGETNKFTATPNSGYYLESITCTNGYTVSDYSTGTSATGTQTVTLNNNSRPNGGTCTVNFRILCPYKIGQTWEFNYTGGLQNFSPACNGTYRMELYGAQGGNYASFTGGKGGKTQSEYILNNRDSLDIYIGSMGNSIYGGNNPLGWSGGSSDANGAGGGSSSVIKINRNSVSEILLLAAGGGGANLNYSGGLGGQASKYLNSNSGASGTGGGGSGYKSGIGGQIINNTKDYIWIPNMSDQDKDFNIDRSAVTGSYTKFYGNENAYGYTEKYDGVYSYIQMLGSGAINEVFTGYVNTIEGQGLRFNAMMDVQQPADYENDQSYVEYVDQNGNILYRLTFRQIKNQVDYGSHNRSTYVVAQHEDNKYYGHYNFDVSFVIPKGVSKVGFRIHCVSQLEFGNSANSGIYVTRFGLSDLGYQSSGGTNFINYNYNASNYSELSGIQNGNGYAKITLIGITN